MSNIYDDLHKLLDGLDRKAFESRCSDYYEGVTDATERVREWLNAHRIAEPVADAPEPALTAERGRDFELGPGYPAAGWNGFGEWLAANSRPRFDKAKQLDCADGWHDYGEGPTAGNVCIRCGHDLEAMGAP